MIECEDTRLPWNILAETQPQVLFRYTRYLLDQGYSQHPCTFGYLMAAHDSFSWKPWSLLNHTVFAIASVRHARNTRPDNLGVLPHLARDLEEEMLNDACRQHQV